MLAEALKNNPDIRVAAAKLTMAEAELNQARLQVMQKVITLHAAIESQKAEVAYRQKQLDRFKELATQGSIDSKLLDEAMQKLALAKAKLAELEAQMPALLGKVVHAEADADGQKVSARLALEWLAKQNDSEVRREAIAVLALVNAPKATGPLAERMRKALQTPVKVDYKDVDLADVLKDLEKKAPGLSLRDFPHGIKVQMHFEEGLPVAAILQALADSHELRFLVRDYGILVTTQRYTPPPGALTVEEFLRQKPGEEPRRQSSSGKNPPAENVEGVVKSVDASGLVTISLGSDAGLAKGHTLELFRVNPAASTQSKYLGTVRVIESEAHQSVAQPVGRLTAPAQAGDRVTSRLLGK
jgi:hypothetical protein